MNKKPLCVDCDGTLISTDLLFEAFLLMLKQYPVGVFFLPFWLFKGKVHLKEKLAHHVMFNWIDLPYRHSVLNLIKCARAEGRHVVLVTASPLIWAKGVAKYLACFDQVLATEKGVNLSGVNKAAHLTRLYGERGFDYVADSVVDLPIWAVANEAIVVSKGLNLSKQAAKISSNVQLMQLPSTKFAVYLRALRTHQWLKNLLVIVPLLAAHQLQSLQTLTQVIYAFVAFSLCASSVYVLNDLLDLDADRQHVRKRNRPFAACNIPIWQGMLMVPILLSAAFLISFLLPTHFTLALTAYFIMTLAYSIRLKRQVIVDVMLLAGLYTMRIIAGAAATAIKPSFWLLAFSMFIFLSLALIKRYSELLITLQNNKQAAVGRGYCVNDLPLLMSIGTSSGLGSVLILSLYLNNPETNIMYPNITWLWLMPALLLYWISRMWMKAHRGQVDDDPVVFATRDWQSLLVLSLTVGAFIAAANN